MRTMGDSSTPLVSYPPVDAWGFYIGGDTPHVWTDAEIQALPVPYGVPIYVRDNPFNGDPVVDADAVISWATAHTFPLGKFIALDFETAEDANYVNVFTQKIAQAGYRTLLYGSASTVLHNPAPQNGGYWTANWDGQALLQPAYALATQFQHNPGYDLSVLAESVELATISGLVPAKIPWRELKEGDSGQDVTILQEVLNNKSDAGLSLDGIFGPATVHAVMDFQQAYFVDGVIGPLTRVCLTSEIPDGVELDEGDTGTYVRVLQEKLNALPGLLSAPLQVDGIFGPLTLAAVRLFQQHVFVDGIVGPLTDKALGLPSS